ncbi:MAG: hypothetical protein ACI9DJ_000102 [Algoriphagus sp.]
MDFTGTQGQSSEILSTEGLIRAGLPELGLIGNKTPRITGKRSSGTLASPTAISKDYSMLELNAYGYAGFSFNERASIEMRASEHWTSIFNGSHIRFMTTPIGHSLMREQMRLVGSGYLGLNNSNPTVPFM